MMEFDLRFTDKEITAWGGMGLMKRMLDHLGFEPPLPLRGCRNPAAIVVIVPSNSSPNSCSRYGVAPIALSMVKSRGMIRS